MVNEGIRCYRKEGSIKELLNACLYLLYFQVSLELGGNAPFIVFEDADLDVALNALMASKFRNAGQACIASNRILVQESIYDKFSELVVKRVQSLRLGYGMDADVTIGPLINEKGLHKVSKHRITIQI